MNPCAVWQVRYCGKKSWGCNVFSQKTCSCKQSELCFSEKLFLVSLSQKNQTAYKTLIKEQISKAPGHERVQFTLVGLFSGFTVAAFFFQS